MLWDCPAYGIVSFSDPTHKTERVWLLWCDFLGFRVEKSDYKPDFKEHAREMHVGTMVCSDGAQSCACTRHNLASRTWQDGPTLHRVHGDHLRCSLPPSAVVRTCSVLLVYVRSAPTTSDYSDSLL